MLWEIAILAAFVKECASGDHIWCGKVYRPRFPATDPGGAIQPPTLSPTPLLDFKAQPRFTSYTEDDDLASLLVTASLSRIHGQVYEEYPRTSSEGDQASNVTSGSASQDRLIINAHIHTSPGSPQQIIARHSILVGLDPTELHFPITFLRPQLAAYKIEVTGQSLATNRTFSTSTQLSCLLLRQDGGSIARIDQKYSSIQVLSGYPNHPPSNPSLNPPAQQILSSHTSWTPIFPFSFYLAGPWLSSSASNMAHFRSLGYNVLHIIPDIGEGYSWPELSRWLDEAERLDLWLMFDMRHQYQDPAWISRIVPMIAKRSNMLLWYTTDEPDGHEDPLDAPQRAYNQIKKLDPYHPISLCLNCENYHFEEYASGADILLADTYPIGTNTSLSTVWGTECNTTYGCCGCDNCHGIDNITNVAERFDTWRTFQTQLGWNVQKPIWTVPQAFGPELHWQRRPDPREIVAMTVIAMNHGAKGSVAWMWPTPEDLVQPTSHLAKVLTDPEVVRFTLGARLIPSSDFHVQGTRSTSLDIAGWIDVPNDRILISIVNAAHEDIPGPVSITVPDAIQITGILKTWWGDGGWRVASPATTQAGRRHNLLFNDDGIRGINVDLFTIGLVSNGGGSAEFVTRRRVGRVRLGCGLKWHLDRTEQYYTRPQRRASKEGEQ